MKLLKQLRAQLIKDWGKKCKDYCFGCAVFAVHRNLEELESVYEMPPHNFGIKRGGDKPIWQRWGIW